MSFPDSKIERVGEKELIHYPPQIVFLY